MKEMQQVLISLIKEARKRSSQPNEQNLYEYTIGELLQRWLPEFEKERVR